MRPAVLLVGPTAPALAEALPHDRLDAHAAGSDAAAAAYLSGTAFDHVLCLGPSAAADTARRLGLDVQTLPADTAADGIARALGLATPGTASPDASRDAARATGDRGEAARRLAALRAEIDRVAHDLNNPVAVILGNAQLARALAPDLPDDVAAALADIEEAAGVLADRARALGALRTRVDGALAALGQSRQS